MKINEVIARTLQSQRTGVVNCVPGFGGTQVYESWCALRAKPPQYSFHEEVAFAIAQGASIAGQRAAVLCKTHGLAKAANAVIDSLYLGATGGLVLLVFDDRQGRHSDNIFNAEALIKGLRLPYHQPQAGGIAHALAEAFAQSEKQKLPVALLLDAGVVDQEEDYRELASDFVPVPFRRNLPANLVVPLFAAYQFGVVNAKIAGQDFSALPVPDIPSIPEGLPPAYAEYVKPYMPFFDVFKKWRGKMVFGDTGVSTLFALPPYDCVDACSYMGGSVPLAAGAVLAGYKNSWAVTGDFSFIAAGHLGLIEAVAKKIPVKVLIMKNDRAQTTGGQPLPEGLLDSILSGFGRFVVRLDDPDNYSKTESAIRMALKSEDMQIVVCDFTQK